MIRRGRAAVGDSWFFLLSMVFDDVVLLRRGERNFLPDVLYNTKSLFKAFDLLPFFHVKNKHRREQLSLLKPFKLLKTSSCYD